MTRRRFRHRLVDLASAPRWDRDAFLFGNESRDVNVARAVALSGPDPWVTSILFSPSRRLAIVGGELMKIGDRIGADQVVDIVRDAVVLKTQSGERRQISLLPPMPEGVKR